MKALYKNEKGDELEADTKIIKRENIQGHELSRVKNVDEVYKGLAR